MDIVFDWNSAVFSKTSKALEELADRRHGLRARARQLLVLVDGARPIISLLGAKPTPEQEQLVNELLDSGFIATDTAGQSANKHATVQIVESETSRASPITDLLLDPVKLARVKTYLIDTGEQHLGLMAARLQQEIAIANDEKALRSAIAHWNMAMRESRSGHREADECLKTAHALIGWEA